METETTQQVLVWPGTIVGEEKVKEFTDWFKETFGVECSYLEEVKTLPDQENGRDVEGTGGRNDLFFSVSHKDSEKIAIQRIQFGMRWWEDVLGNGNGVLYPREILDKYPNTWGKKKETVEVQ